MRNNYKYMNLKKYCGFKKDCKFKKNTNLNWCRYRTVDIIVAAESIDNRYQYSSCENYYNKLGSM